ncbi:hypothetical protein JOF35_003787 [Streptomyces demainii]|uniref:Uncharacterized protein n=1 Tax=Streptomyces demainii TaxID=588122 RepID=A0ABT9KTQ5_9ACTN|nr:hypothetical protein [Streptomyces demainii]
MHQHRPEMRLTAAGTARCPGRTAIRPGQDTAARVAGGRRSAFGGAPGVSPRGALRGVLGALSEDRPSEGQPSEAPTGDQPSESPAGHQSSGVPFGS